MNQANASGGAAHMKNALTKNILPYSIMGGLELGGAVACVFVRCASCVVCNYKEIKVSQIFSIDRRCADARAAAQRQRDAAPHRCAKKRAVER